MPVLDVEIIGEPDAGDRSTLARRLADAAAGILGSSPGGTWVKVRVLPPGDYAENGGPAAGILPVFVGILKRTNPDAEALAVEVRDLTEAIARVCGRPPENVHIRYEAPGLGRQAFGGRVVS